MCLMKKRANRCKNNKWQFCQCICESNTTTNKCSHTQAKIEVQLGTAVNVATARIVCDGQSNTGTVHISRAKQNSKLTCLTYLREPTSHQ